MVTEVRLLQSRKAPIPILVTLSGIVIEVRPVCPENAPASIISTVFGIMVVLQPAISLFVDFSIIALQLSRESYMVFPAPTVIEVRPVQP